MKIGLYITSLVAGILLLVGCKVENKPIVVTPEDRPRPTFTIMYYAVGGGTLDEAIERTITDLAERGAKQNIRFTGCVKWTKGYTSELSDGEGSVYRFRLDNSSSALKLDRVSDNNYALHDPKSIADFIRWSKEASPADNYILVLAGHGNGWHPEVGLLGTRGTLRDTDLDRYISLEELCQGIAASDTHFRMIQMISCLMNTVEYITPLADYCDYILASSHISVMLCTELAFLQMSLREIEEQSNEAFIDAIGGYLDNIKLDIELKMLSDEVLDFSLTDTREVAALNGEIKRLTAMLLSLYDKADSATIAKCEEELAKAYYYIAAHSSSEEMAQTEYLRMAFTYDIVDIARRAAVAIGDSESSDIASALALQAARARVLNYTTTLKGVDEVYYGVTLTNGEKWVERGYAEAGYEDTKFDQTTGWSHFLKRNNIEVAY